MNGAESLVKTLLAGGIDTCFANPGTSEMHFVAALDRVPGMRCVLGLFEGVVTGAADGYARITDRPAATLLHCGPGLANGLANLHNAWRAHTMMVNCIGDTATYLRHLDPPLTQDTQGWARPVSGWLRTVSSVYDVGSETAAAIAAARSNGGCIATLVLPSDVSWNEGGVVGKLEKPADARKASEEELQQVVQSLKEGKRTLLLLGGRALRADALAQAHRIARVTGARILASTLNARTEAGLGRFAIGRVPIPIDQALDVLKDFEQIILVGADKPVIFFAYPHKPLTPVLESTRLLRLTRPDGDAFTDLQRLADLLGAPSVSPPERTVASKAAGALTPTAVAHSVAALLPEQAIVVDESISLGRLFHAALADAAAHDWLQLTGGAIGSGLPLATGAAIAAPGRRTVCLEGDGSSMYTIQALWTQARERLNVTTVILSNRKYAILLSELTHVGATPGRVALDMLDLTRPEIDFVRLAESMGVEAARADSIERFNDLYERANGTSGPFLIEVAC